MSGLNFVGSPDFVDRSPTARHSSNGARRSRRGSAATTVDPRLSIIEEDHPSPPGPSSQPVTHNRAFSQRFFGAPPRYANGQAPPKYSFFPDVTGPKGEKFQDLRDNKFIARRGGWKRLCIIGFLLLLVVIALVVGLAVGLSKRNRSNSDSTPAGNSTTNSTTPVGPFPAGSYTLTTFLSTISTNCTSNPQSWTCEPSRTYSQSPSDAQAVFNWVISSVSSTSTNFTITSSSNPFTISFPNTTLNLLDAGTDNERYSFKAGNVQKMTYPSPNIKCFYNETTFSGNMYTRKPKTYPSGTGASSTAPSPSTSAVAGTFADWNYAVDASQSIGGGVDVPQCFQWENGVLGAPITQGYTEEPMGAFCSCAYANYQ